ncbi:MAG TPA: hypothetical protein DF712_00065 [Balneola sp.]|nr:hypothetical protein [Balneola sp.]|tara:strand:- start:759 stop:1241 length:483 start_codon:yes stop_codon:yes gene_type:complete
MKIKVASNFSFAKLINYIETNKGFGEVIDKYITEPLIEDSKKKIREDFVTPPTTRKTLRKRRARKFPKSLGSNSTLYDTGKLHDSIRLSDKVAGKKGVQASILLKNAKRIEMVEYGKYHQLGIGKNKKREFLDLTIKNAETASKELIKRMVRSWKKRLAK